MSESFFKPVATFDGPPIEPAVTPSGWALRDIRWPYGFQSRDKKHDWSAYPAVPTSYRVKA